MIKIILVAGFILIPALFAASPNFVPDFLFKGSALGGWQKLGESDWRAENGEIIGTPKQPDGVLLRAEKTASRDCSSH